MYVQLHSVKEPSKNHHIWVWVLFSSLRGRVFRFVRVLAHFFLSSSVWFLAKPGFLFCSFLLGNSCSFPSLTVVLQTRCRALFCGQ